LYIVYTFLWVVYILLESDLSQNLTAKLQQKAAEKVFPAAQTIMLKSSMNRIDLF